MKKNYIQYVTTIFILLIFNMNVCSADINFSVDIIYPENQIEKGNGYFYIDNEDNKEQKIETKIKNFSNNDIILNIETASCYSSPTGDFIYMKNNQNTDYGFTDNNYLFENNIQTAASKIELKSQEIKIVDFYITPSTAHEGEVIGAVRFFELTTGINEDINQRNIQINIKNSITIPVRVRLTQYIESNISPIEIGDVIFIPDEGLLNLSIANNLPFINRNTVFSYEIYNSNNEILFGNKIDLIKMAPKSFIMLPVKWNYLTAPQGDYKIKIGYYRYTPDILYETRNFSIIKEQSDDFRQNNNQQTNGIFIKTEYLFLTGFLFILFIILFLFVKNKRIKK